MMEYILDNLFKFMSRNNQTDHRKAPKEIYLQMKRKHSDGIQMCVDNKWDFLRSLQDVFLNKRQIFF